ncbi:MAG: hypothetical protein K8963_08305, partial [Proteobacteria bacterium]|nr:hypothetical protein [Pseudomonadota bacterium]
SRADISISILPLPRLFNLVGLCELTVGEYYEIVIPGYQGGTVNLVGGGRYYVSEPSGYPQSCASAPSLPAGLRVAPHSTLDTCVISGTPEEPSAEATYTITAANASGADDGSVDIVVYPLVAAPALADLPDQIIAVGQEIDLTFANTGDAPAAETGCAVRPTLPAGMAVAVADDGSTCTITGVSTAASASVIYTVTATNTAGSSDASVSIRIDADTASTAVRIAQVSAGLEHTCAISEGGQLYCWGINYDHQLGLGIDEANYMRPVLVGTDSDWATVSAGYNGTCAVKTDGSLYCWGILRRELNLSSQLGSEPTRIGDSYDWVDVEINTRVCALKSSGQLFCWGLGEYGVLGNGDSASRSEPTLVGNTPESGWSGMNFGTDSACAIDADEQLYCWGKSVYRLLTNEIERGIRYVPTAIGDLSWSAVATEDSAICAISTEGRLYCWGYSERGGLGNGVDGRSTLTEPTQVGQAENWRQISTGHQNACAVNEQNQLYCWGFGRFGALGLGDEANRTTPTRVGVRNDWAQVSFGSDHVCAVNLSAELYCWGIGYAGALGVGDTDGRLEPALVLIDSTEPVVDGSGPDNNGDGNNPDTTPTGDPDDDANNPDTTPTGDPDDVADETTEPAPAQFVQISTGSNYTCAVDGDGDLNCWGPGVAIGFSSLFGGYYPAPTTVALGEGMNWASVSAGGALVCAITTEGALYCWEVHPCPLLSWGFSDASLGSGPFRGAYMVAQSNWSQVSAGKLHACAINSDDELHCWGDGSGGRLGTVDNTPGRVGANYTWADVSAGVGHTCASNTQGELYCWGRGDDGQLGLNDNTNYSTPRRVGADTDWADISVGSYHSCAVKSSGQLFCWGSDDSDQLGLGQGNLNNAAYPTRVGSGENWATVSSGARHTCALTDASEYYCWGTGPVNRYFFATSTTIDWHRPVLMSNRADWTQITGGNSMLCALNTRGYAYCSRPFFYSITSTAPINEVDNFDFFPDPARRTN